MNAINSDSMTAPSLVNRAAPAPVAKDLDVCAARMRLGVSTLLIVMPFAFGGARLWALSASVIGVSMLAAYYAWNLSRGTAAKALGFRDLTLSASLYGLCLVWAALQAGAFMPSSFGHPLWQQAAAALGTQVASSVSLDRFASVNSIMKLSLYAATFWIVVQLTREVAMARSLLLVVVIGAAVHATIGMVAFFTNQNFLPIYANDFYKDVVVAPFDNRNNLATYLGLAFLAGMALFYDRYGGLRRAWDEAGLDLRRFDQMAQRLWLLALSVVVVFTALMLTGSRGGFAATLIGFGVFLFALSKGERTHANERRHAYVILGACLVGALVLASGDLTTGRIISSLAQEDERLPVYRLSWEALLANLRFGTGLGSFESVFTTLRDFDVVSRFTHAHNDYLETAIELGVPGYALMMGAIVAVVARTVRGAMHRRRYLAFPCMGIGATVLVAVHSMVDFGIQIPSVGVLYATLLGVAFAQSFRTKDVEGSERRSRRQTAATTV